MITIRHAADRGHANHGWLDSHHTFSFADYYDEEQMGFRALRVINDDTVAPSQGFGTHGHQDMEILSYVLDGELSHRDSMGTVATLRAGDIQVMSAGTGVRHSEFNGNDQTPVHFLQIWIVPKVRGVKPRYADARIPAIEKTNQLKLIASGAPRDGALPIHQDADVYATMLEPGKSVTLQIRPGRHAWVHLARGSLSLNGQTLATGDGAAISDEAELQLQAGAEAAEALIFDLA